ncbi:LytTR family transcriptional regulator DNA-binding domain-containing protein [Bhargavaea ginsengi]|uniref:LytTR family transcriptional regulator DNA-binding domain-containing protein n=1 Tax=Bhargavaea ginsengi TaxID=426757 RepID=UPI00203BAB8E|nr:LytTR family transcriptional regulator DNA-binding domain-containing protein [Bhargavaea ginsengi]MCM3087927.1 LytTR family transcriptional regulator DNA-binding domain-containing protein [Bhargavaea ginsengi]
MGILEFHQVEKMAGNQVVFPRFDLSVESGAVTAVQCEHEAGLQLIGMVTGMAPASHGEVRFAGELVGRQFRNLASRIGVVLLDDALYERLTPSEQLRLFRNLHNTGATVEDLLRQVGLEERGRTRISKLSYSEKRRVQLARALVHKPDLLILQEPEQNLDVESRIILQRVLAEFTADGGAVLLTTSNLENAVTMGDTVYRLNAGGLKLFEVAEEEESLEDSVPVEETVPETEGDTPSPQLQFNKIPAKVNEKLILFDPTEIVFVESVEGVSQLHVQGETFPCAIKMADLETRLQPFGFFRCHRSYIVNLQRVREVITWTRNSYSLILEDPNKSTVPLSKGKYAELKTFLGI